MSEFATIQNFMSRDKSEHVVDVVARFPGGQSFGVVVSKKSIVHYKALWAERYELTSGYFDGHGWYTDLKGEFPSKVAADEAIANLKAVLQKADTLEGERR